MCYGENLFYTYTYIQTATTTTTKNNLMKDFIIGKVLTVCLYVFQIHTRRNVCI